MPRRIWVALTCRSLSQCVAAARLAFDAFPVVPSFVWFRPPCRDDPSFFITSVRVNYRDFKPVYQVDCLHSRFAVIETIVYLLNRRPIKDPLRVLESNAMPRKVAAVLPFVPTITHSVYLRNVNIAAGNGNHSVTQS